VLLSILLWSLAMLFVVAVHRKNNRDISLSLFLGNAFLAWLLLILHSTSFKTLGWVTGHISDVSTYYYIQVGYIPPWAHLLLSLLEIPIGIIAILLAFGIAKGKDAYRVFFLKFLPILFLSGAIGIFSGYIGHDPHQRNDLFVGTLVALSYSILMYAAFYWFYRRATVISSVFKKTRAT
jgi:hypothetical protein